MIGWNKRGRLFLFCSSFSAESEMGTCKFAFSNVKAGVYTLDTDMSHV